MKIVMEAKSAFNRGHFRNKNQYTQFSGFRSLNKAVQQKQYRTYSSLNKQMQTASMRKKVHSRSRIFKANIFHQLAAASGYF